MTATMILLLGAVQLRSARRPDALVLELSGSGAMMMWMMEVVRAVRLGGVAACFSCLLTAGAGAQNFIPDVAYDPDVPTVEDVLGAEMGTRITASADVITYFRALAAYAPDRMVVRSYARSWQGRELVYAIIGTPERIAALDDISANMLRLADPRETSSAEADELIAELPSSAWLAYSVHGNEISGSDAAMMTAYHLVAAQGDPVVQSILDNTLVFLDPAQNPDGRDRFVNAFYNTLGLEPSGSPIAAERNEPWPRGRTNHYLFDLNRDWFALTQPETRGRVAAFLEWMPLIFVDLHEMGSNSTYYFSPEAVPYNPDITQSQRDLLDVIGRNNARWFDRFGFRYFTREVYDAFYPGYGAAWPLFHGSIGTTYEQASARGLLASRYDGTDLSFADTVRHHFTASIATLETAAVNRERLLREFYDYRASAIEEGRSSDPRVYIIPPQEDQATADKLAGLLTVQGVEVMQAESAFRACRVHYDAGSYVIASDQPAGRLVRTLMELDRALEEDFVAEQERRRSKDLEVEIYDVTAWSLPLMFNVEVETCGDAPSGSFMAAEPVLIQPGALTTTDEPFAYLAPWGTPAAVRLLASALREDIPVSSADAGFTHDGRSYPAGTLIFQVSDGPDDLADRLSNLAEISGADIVGVADSWVTEGPNFGSDRVAVHLPPRIAIAWDEPTRANSAGNTRYVIERELGYPVTPIRTEDLTSAQLETFDVLILPDGTGYSGVLGGGGAEHLTAWVENGGVLIGLDRAVRYLADPDTDLLSIRREEAFRDEDAEEESDEDGPTVPGTRLDGPEALDAASTPFSEPPDSVAGVLTRAIVDSDHWLAAGVKEQLYVLMSGADIYSPARRDAGANVVTFAGADDLLASGYMWEETRLQLAYKPFVVAEEHGRGLVIGFTQEPTTRAYLDGLNVLLANALFRAPAHARPPR